MAVFAARSMVLLAFPAAFLWTPAAASGDETCDFNTSCILTCSEEVDNAEVIHWHHICQGEKLIVHSYYDRKDHLENQNQRYKNRTSLVENQTSKRRTSLQLTGVQIGDQGTYECYTSNSGGFVRCNATLRVNAPVDSVSMRREGTSTTCSSEGIYPQPQLTWSTEPPSNLTLQDDPTVLAAEDQHYNITSSLTLSRSDENLSYSCNISTRSNWKKVTQRQYLYNETQIEIPCRASNTSLRDFSLIWRFNHSEIIVTGTLPSVTYNVSDQWKRHVKEVSQPGNLVLQKLKSSQAGTYTCELRQAGNGLITENEILITQTAPRQSEASASAVVQGIVLAVVIIGGIAVGLALCQRRRNRNASRVRYSNQPSEPEDSPNPEATAFIQTG